MTALIKYEAACRSLAAAHSVDEVKDIRDKAEAMRVYAIQAKNVDLEVMASEIRLRGERRLGELLIEAKAQGRFGRGRPPKNNSQEFGEYSARIDLAELGVDHNLSSRSQKLGGITEQTFEAMVASTREQIRERGSRGTLATLAAEEKQQRRVKEAEEYAARTAVGCNVTDLAVLAASGARFSVIYADPPWEFRTYSGQGKDRSADRHYNTGGLDTIKTLPVASLAADNCALLMWAVMPELRGALEVIQAWGFEYKTVGFTWVKQNKSSEGLFLGMGYWTRANAELCLLATKGSPERIAKDVHQVVLSPIEEHSRKPDEVAKRIERLLRGPYLELYARREREGWTTWGNEIARESFLPQHEAA